MTFGAGEAALSEWMAENAFVTWNVCEDAWKLEAQLISRVCLPRNLDQDRHRAFHSVLSDLRRESKRRARDLCQNAGVPRKQRQESFVQMLHVDVYGSVAELISVSIVVPNC